MAPHRPRVTFVVPSFNEPAQIISQSLASVAAQTFDDFECLVVDESTDPQAAANCRALCAQDPRFRYLRPERRLGLAGSLNLGIAQARGELIARFDSDDLCLPDRLAKQVSFLAEHPEVDVLGGGLEIIDEDGRTLAFRSYPQTHDGIERRMHFTTTIAHPTVMMRRRVIEACGGYNPEFRFAEDLDLWLRLLNHGVQFANLPLVLVRYRQQNTRRSSRHWRFNLRARTRNFGLRRLPQRLLGLAAIALWSSLPDTLQERIFHRLVLRCDSSPIAPLPR